LQEAQNARSPTEKLVEKVAKWYTPLVVLGAATMATVPWAFGRETGVYYFHTALVLLVVACPCALVISTPVTYVCGLAHAAQRGLLVKGESVRAHSFRKSQVARRFDTR
jgi:Cd2+/Zn2+-exporting ATPase